MAKLTAIRRTELGPIAAEVGKTAVVRALAGAADVDRLVDGVLAEGFVWLTDSLVLIAGHVSPAPDLRAYQTNSRTERITLVCQLLGPWSIWYDVVSRQVFASRYRGSPDAFDAIRHGEMTTWTTEPGTSAHYRDGTTAVREMPPGWILDAFAGPLERFEGTPDEAAAWLRAAYEAGAPAPNSPVGVEGAPLDAELPSPAPVPTLSATLSHATFTVRHWSAEGTNAFLPVDVDEVGPLVNDRDEKVGYGFLGTCGGYPVEFHAPRSPEMKRMARLVRKGARPHAYVDRGWVRNAEAIPAALWLGQQPTAPPLTAAILAAQEMLAPAPAVARSGGCDLLVMWWLFPAGVLFHYGKTWQGLACLLLQLSVIGWPLAIIWANVALAFFEEG